MDSEIIQFIVSQVGLAGITYFSLLMNERQVKESLRREQETNEQLVLLLNRTISTLEKNGEVTSALLQSIHEFGERILYIEGRTKRDEETSKRP